MWGMRLQRTRWLARSHLIQGKPVLAPGHSEARAKVFSSPHIDFKCSYPNKTSWLWTILLSCLKRSLAIILKISYFYLYTMCKYIFMYAHGMNIHNTYTYSNKWLFECRLRSAFLQAVCGCGVLLLLSSSPYTQPFYLSWGLTSFENLFLQAQVRSGMIVLCSLSPL